MHPTSALEYKQAKEAWVSDCTGGSIMEVMLLASSCVISHGLWLALVNAGMLPPSWVNGYMVPLVIYVVPAVLIETIAADASVQVLLGVLFLTLNVVYRTPTMQRLHALQQQAAASSSTSSTSSPTINTPNTKSYYKSYLTVYRAATMILTCIAILAVDFPVFPRRFAKVETFGTSLMDVGVGSFVFSSGIVASRSYTTPHGNSMWTALRSSIPLLVLGGARLVLTRGVDYQLHSSEYGLHWNFFITLGLLAPFVALLPKRNLVPFGYLGFMVLGTYQVLLWRYGLQTWVLQAPRVDLISANKEGIASFLGYLGIFLLGVDNGMLLFTDPSAPAPAASPALSSSDKTKAHTPSAAPVNKTSVVVKLSVRCVLYWLSLAACYLIMEKDHVVSRRLANFPYAMWVVAFNLTLLTALMCVEQQISESPQAPALLTSINANGLATFLVANVMTGVVNLSMQTLYASTISSMLVLAGYMVAVTLFPWILAKYNIRIKL
ncbi:GWT1-domain-containing protein [Absidia repens]|uniref:GPI-anchored wall transfer protein n=1 Tax=Absidia repens TaxID=90262 RepID=A0A1X2I165_9FUNG|nr:GWT1-domain-containing protein [Absidia repens]